MSNSNSVNPGSTGITGSTDSALAIMQEAQIQSTRLQAGQTTTTAIISANEGASKVASAFGGAVANYKVID